MKIDLLSAIDAALAGDWDRAHKIVQQDEDSPLSCWAHGIVHLMEGDKANARYWYKKAGRPFGEDVPNEIATLTAACGR